VDAVAVPQRTAWPAGVLTLTMMPFASQDRRRTSFRWPGDQHGVQPRHSGIGVGVGISDSIRRGAMRDRPER